jgi:deoxyguanosine kinase
MESLTQPYIVFEGPIGVGKTTLARLLSEHMRSTLILEDPDGNEFLCDFYQDKPRWALPMQLWFLAARYRQLQSTFGETSETVIADYSFAKNRIFARMLLVERELRLYEHIDSGLDANIPLPSLIVYLDASNDVLRDRITKRTRTYENLIDGIYQDRIRTYYEEYFRSMASLRVFRYDTNALDIHSQPQLDNLYAEILAAAKIHLNPVATA